MWSKKIDRSWLTQVIREVSAYPDAVTPSSRFAEDLGIDSLGLLAIAFKIEEQIRVDLAPHATALAQIRTVADLERFLLDLQSAA